MLVDSSISHSVISMDIDSSPIFTVHRRPRKWSRRRPNLIIRNTLMGSSQSVGVWTCRKYPLAAMRSIFRAVLSFYRQNVPQRQSHFTSLPLMGNSDYGDACSNIDCITNYSKSSNGGYWQIPEIRFVRNK